MAQMYIQMANSTYNGRKWFYLDTTRNISLSAVNVEEKLESDDHLKDTQLTSEPKLETHPMEG